MKGREMLEQTLESAASSLLFCEDPVPKLLGAARVHFISCKGEREKKKKKETTEYDKNLRDQSESLFPS